MSNKTKSRRPPISSLELPAKLFRGLGDLSRLSILNALRGGPLTVGQIVDVTALSQSNTSNHLRCLSECGLVVGEQRGRFVHYSLTDARIAELLAVAEDLLEDVTGGIDSCANYSR